MDLDRFDHDYVEGWFLVYNLRSILVYIRSARLRLDVYVKPLSTLCLLAYYVIMESKTGRLCKRQALKLIATGGLCLITL